MLADRVRMGSGKYEKTFFVGVFNNYIQTSIDGKVWEIISQPSITNGKIAYGNGKYIVAGLSGKMYLSTNLVSWNSVDHKLGTSSLNISFGNGVFIATDNDGGISRSEDGVNWTIVYSDKGTFSVACNNNNMWVISGGGRKLVSHDNGISWTSTTVSYGLPNYSLATDIVYYKDKFIETNHQGNINITTDGINWTNVLLTNNSSDPLNTLGFSDSTIYAMSSRPNKSNRKSGNGVNWTNSGHSGTGTYSLAYGNNIWVRTQNNNVPQYSDDGLIWNNSISSEVNGSSLIFVEL